MRKFGISFLDRSYPARFIRLQDCLKLFYFIVCFKRSFSFLRDTTFRMTSRQSKKIGYATTHSCRGAAADNVVADQQIRLLHQIVVHSHYLQLFRHGQFSDRQVNASRTFRDYRRKNFCRAVDKDKRLREFTHDRSNTNFGRSWLRIMNMYVILVICI